MSIEEEVLERFNKIVKGKEVTKDKNIKDLGLDSLDIIEMLTDMEEKYSIEFDNDEMTSLVTVGDVILLIFAKIKK